MKSKTKVRSKKIRTGVRAALYTGADMGGDNPLFA
jgi:hypothetical protein